MLAFSVLLALVTTLISGAIPAVQSSRTDINEILKDDSRGASSFRIGRITRALVVFEVALSCGLLVAAGLTIKSVSRMQTMDQGYTTTNVFTARIGFPEAYTDTLAEWRFFDQVIQRVSGLPGVQSAAISSGHPGARQGYGNDNVAIEGQTYVKDKDYPKVRILSASPGLFATLQTPLVQGRVFNASDRADGLRVPSSTRRS